MAKIPPQAKKVFEGVIFDVYQWPQPMYDGSTTTFEMLRRADSAIVVGVTPDHQILTITDEQPNRPKVITFPGGRIEAGEDHMAAAKREFLEETGYVSDDWALWQEFEVSSKTEATFRYYLARNVRKVSEQQLDGGEIIDLRLVSFDQFFDDVIHGRQRSYEFSGYIMQQLLQGKKDELIAFMTGDATI